MGGSEGHRVAREVRSAYLKRSRTSTTCRRSPLSASRPAFLAPTDTFPRRHLGPDEAGRARMLATLGVRSLDELVDQTVPKGIRLGRELDLPPAQSESEALADLRSVARRNTVLRSLIGMGYYGHPHAAGHPAQHPREPGLVHAVHAVPGRDRAGAPRGAAQLPDDGLDLTGMLEIANASLLDEGTAAAEAMAMCHRRRAKGRATASSSSRRCHPQTIAVVKHARGRSGIEVVVGDHASHDFADGTFGALVQYPDDDGAIVRDYAASPSKVHARAGCRRRDGPARALRCSAPGEFGADVASARRSASACRWATAARTRRSSRRATSSSAHAGPHHRRLEGRGGKPRCAWRCRRASSTSAARRRRATSARRRCCSR
jgi:hypothetical protein